MLITFGAMWTPGCDVTPIVETTRFTLKEMLPRNRKGTRLVMLPIAFEVAVGHWVRGPGDHRVFALPPQERNALLDNVRAHLDPDEEYRMVIVVRNHELRPYVALLVKQEFPLLTVLAERELCDDLRSYAGVLDPSPSGGQGGTTPDPVVAGGKVHYAC
jgi:flagellar biosynthesis component FlhA